MDNLPEAPEGYRYKIVLVKKGLTEAWMRKKEQWKNMKLKRRKKETLNGPLN